MSGYKVNADYTFTIERGSAWGTAVDTAPEGLPTEEMTMDIEANAHRLNRAWGYRGQHEDNTWQDTFGKIPTASSMVILTPEIITLLMPGILQSSADWTDTLDVYSMYTNNYADLPSPKTSNDGYYYTLVRNSPEAGDDEVIDSAVPSSVTLSISPDDNDGVLVGQFEFIGDTYTRGQSQSGSVTHLGLDYMYQWGDIVSVSFGGADLTSDFVSAEINVTSGAKLVSDIPNGEVVFPKWEITGTLKVIANASTEAMKDKVLSRDVALAEPLVIAFGSSATTPALDGDLIITSHAYLTNWTSDYAEGEVIDFEFEGVFGGAGEYPIALDYFHTTV